MKCAFHTVLILSLASEICGAWEIGSEILDHIPGIHNRFRQSKCGPGFRSRGMKV